MLVNFCSCRWNTTEKYNKSLGAVTRNTKLKETLMRVQKDRKVFSSALVIGALLLVRAGTLTAQEVRYNSMPGTDFSKYQTYKWVNVKGAHPDQIMYAEIKQSVD